MEWVLGLLQPGFVRWASPPASQNHFNHWGRQQRPRYAERRVRKNLPV